MKRYNSLLTDPTPDGVHQALKEAAEATQAPQVQSLSWPLPDIENVLQQWLNVPEGWKQWNNTSRVRQGQLYRTVLLMAWWTDFLQRKQLRISSHWVMMGKDHPGFHNLLYGEEDPPSALGMIYPDRCAILIRDDQRELRVICDCGAMGAPEELAWMGEHCGPCNDRQQGADEGIILPEVFNHFIQPEEGQAIASLAWSTNCKYLAINLGTEIQIGDVAKQEISHSWELSDERPLIAFIPRTSRLLVALYSGLVEWSLKTNDRRRITYDPGGFRQLLCSPNGSQAVTLMGECPQVWDLEMGILEGALEPPYEEETIGLWITPNSSALVQCLSRGSVLFWDMKTKALIQELHIDQLNSAHAMAISPRGNWIGLQADRKEGATVASQEVVIYSIQSRSIHRRWEVPAPGSQLLFSPDCQWLILAGNDPRLEFWHIETGQHCALQLSGFTAPQISFSPHGQWLTIVHKGNGHLWSWQNLLAMLNR